MTIKCCEIVILSSLIKVDVAEVLNKRFGLEEWLYILHDKDKESPHYHIYIRFREIISTFDIAKEFRIHDKFIISACALDIKTIVIYLLHGNVFNDEYHYPKEELRSNINLDVYLK